ncbi:hypothetical protein [Actinomycetospora soli]|uniref:hypothetical protein n=1 Tax=Actinomycetospora soli TaxID=2893887 RepID=UPI001E4061AC|nr:hypothetical protein [Actinomycetospora soli]MCD2188524.1 hypothetical protein [Actinomycetospora soli]
MTATDGRTRAGGDDPDPTGPPDTAVPPEEPAAGHPGYGGMPAARSADESGPQEVPAIARMRARAAMSATAPPRPAPGPVPPGVARRVGRHARPESEHTGHTPPPDYRPRHAAPHEDAASADAAAVTPLHQRPPAGPPTPAAPPDVEIDPTPVRGLPLASTFPASGVTASEVVRFDDKKSLYGSPAGPDTPNATPPARQRIVLAERRSPTRAVGTVAEIEQQTATGELLLSNLMRSQLMLAVRLAVVAVIVLGVLPIVFLTMPGVAGTVVFGVSLPWVLLGVLAFPFLLLLGWLYTRTAERNELDFADDVED